MWWHVTMGPWQYDNNVIMIWHCDNWLLCDNYVLTSWQQWGDVWQYGNDIVILIRWFVTIMWRQCGKKGWLVTMTLQQWVDVWRRGCDEDGVTKMMWRQQLTKNWFSSNFSLFLFSLDGCFTEMTFSPQVFQSISAKFRTGVTPLSRIWDVDNQKW
jgi:hypothetical protein